MTRLADMPETILRDILNAGAQAPSGGNSQPWRFEAHDRTALSVWMLPDKDHAILNYRHRGTLLAHGVLIETLVIAARHHGYRAIVSTLPCRDQPTLTARLRFEPDLGAERDDRLYTAIWTRCTNRKPYRTEPLAPASAAALAGVAREPGIDLGFTTDAAGITTLAEAASTSERVMFENRALHRLFFDELVWTDDEARQRRSGLQIDTLEMQPAQRLALRVFRQFPLMRVLNRFGMAASIARANARSYTCCSLYAAIGCGRRDIDLVSAGRTLARLWLTAESLGLSLHLQTGVNFLWQRATDGADDLFSPEHVALIERHYQSIRDVTALPSELIPLLCRIGHGGEPGARSLKQLPEVSGLAPVSGGVTFLPIHR